MTAMYDDGEELDPAREYRQRWGPDVTDFPGWVDAPDPPPMTEQEFAELAAAQRVTPW